MRSVKNVHYSMQIIMMGSGLDSIMSLNRITFLAIAVARETVAQ